MIIDLLKIRNIVERNLRDFKIGSWAVNPPDTADPVPRLKPEADQDQYKFSEVKVLDAHSAIINWSKFDNKIDFVKALSQIIHDVMVDTTSDPLDKTTTSGSKVVTTNEDGSTSEVVTGNIYTTGGSKIPVSEEVVLGSKLSNAVHFKNGTLNPTIVKLDGIQILTTRQPGTPNPSGGSTIDIESRNAIGVILAALRTHGLITP